MEYISTRAPVSLSPIHVIDVLAALNKLFWPSQWCEFQQQVSILAIARHWSWLQKGRYSMLSRGKIRYNVLEA